MNTCTIDGKKEHRNIYKDKVKSGGCHIVELFGSLLCVQIYTVQFIQCIGCAYIF